MNYPLSSRQRREEGLRKAFESGTPYLPFKPEEFVYWENRNSIGLLPVKVPDYDKSFGVIKTFTLGDEAPWIDFVIESINTLRLCPAYLCRSEDLKTIYFMVKNK